MSFDFELLQLKSKGERVRQVQRCLLELAKTDSKYDIGRHGADGDFGQATEKAIKAFQYANSIPDTGIVGPTTWNMLAKLYPNILQLAVDEYGEELKEDFYVIDESTSAFTGIVRGTLRNISD